MILKTKILLFFVGLLFLCNLYGQDYYMYVDGMKRHYKVSTDKILVQYFNNSIDTVKTKKFLQTVNVNLKNITQMYNSELIVVDLENVSKDNIKNLIEQWNVLETNAYVSPIISGEDNFEMSAIPNQILVRVRQENGYSFLTEKLQTYNIKKIESCDLDDKRYLITINNAQQKNSLQIANELYESGLFEYVEPNMFHFIQRNTVDTYFGQQWALKNTGQNIRDENGVFKIGTSGIDIKAEQAWTITTGSPNVKVAVFDSGVDLTHPDLAGNLVQGYNASTDLPDGDVEYGAMMNWAHGTCCAGIIGAIANNNQGIAGIAYNCKIIPMYDGWMTNHLVRGIDWARINGASVISISSIYGETTALNTALNQAAITGRNNLGCVIVASAGNANRAVGYPAKHPYVISVGAIDNQGYRASFSNYGTDLDVVAPGVGIYTTDMYGIPSIPGYTPLGNLYYPTFDGTSAACPYVSGIAALVLSNKPNLYQSQVRYAIESACTKLPGYVFSSNLLHPNSSWNDSIGHGLVNAFNSLLSIPPSPSITGRSRACINSTATFSVSNPPAGYTWTCSANLSPLSASGNSQSFKVNSYASPSWVAVNAGGTELVRYYFSSTYGMGSISIEGPEFIPNYNTYASWTVSVTGDRSAVMYYQWQGFGQSKYTTDSGDYSFTAYFPQYLQNYNETVYVYVEDCCGNYESDYIDVLVDSYKKGGTVYPNPVDDILTVEIEKQSANYNIRLYDINGAIRRQATSKGSNVEFNVSNLPNGIYSLHIYDGTNNRPEMRTIMVQH